MSKRQNECRLAFTREERQDSSSGKARGGLGASMQVVRLALVFGLLLGITLVQGCGGRGSPRSVPTISGVTVSPQSPTIAEGQVQLFSAW
jgi:hypothetical protein